MSRRADEFKALCEAAADADGIDVDFFPIKGKGARRDDEHEDDGFLHISRHGIRAVFNVSNSQSDDGGTQNIKTRSILDALGITPHDPDRVFVEEHDDEEDGERCPHCGGAL